LSPACIDAIDFLDEVGLSDDDERSVVFEGEVGEGFDEDVACATTAAEGGDEVHEAAGQFPGSSCWLARNLRRLEGLKLATDGPEQPLPDASDRDHGRPTCTSLCQSSRCSPFLLPEDDDDGWGLIGSSARGGLRQQSTPLQWPSQRPQTATYDGTAVGNDVPSSEPVKSSSDVAAGIASDEAFIDGGPKLLADLVEAVLGAVLIDSGGDITAVWNAYR
jgi:hypothetical protein